MSIQLRTERDRIALKRTLRATLCEIELGMFYATYPDGEDALPNYQSGKSADEARQRIERSARALGYEHVVWTAANVAPLFPIHREPSARKRSGSQFYRHGA